MAEIKQYGTRIITCNTIRIANEQVTHAEEEGWEVVGVPGEFMGKIMITLKKPDPKKMNQMMQDMMSNLKQ